MTSALMQLTVNGGAPQTGGIELASAASQSIQLSGVNTLGWQTADWEIYSYPSGFNPGGGWTLASDGYTWTMSTTGVPDAFVTSLWGKYMFRVRVNGNPLSVNSDGSPNAAFVQALTDDTTALDVLSPSGQHDIAYGERGQFSVRGWPTASQANARANEASRTQIGLGAPTVAMATTGTTTLTAAEAAVPYVNLGGTILTGGCTLAFPLPAQAGVMWFVDASNVTFGGHAIDLKINSVLMSATMTAPGLWLVVYTAAGKFYAVSLALI